jgi:hypothetical protein
MIYVCLETVTAAVTPFLEIYLEYIYTNIYILKNSQIHNIIDDNIYIYIYKYKYIYIYIYILCRYMDIHTYRSIYKQMQ